MLLAHSLIMRWAESLNHNPQHETLTFGVGMLVWESQADHKWSFVTHGAVFVCMARTVEALAAVATTILAHVLYPVIVMVALRHIICPYFFVDQLGHKNISVHANLLKVISVAFVIESAFCRVTQYVLYTIQWWNRPSSFDAVAVCCRQPH
jgi:hypothetical protein